MKAFIPAAGLGTRLRPFTLTNPKALVEVNGVPMLERVILRLKDAGYDDIVINLHHFGDKIVDFVRSKESFGLKIRFSDERAALLNTGGGILHASDKLWEDDEPFLIHNVDILSNARLGDLMEAHKKSGSGATLLVSKRDSSRQLLFDDDMNLRGWHHKEKNIFKPENINSAEGFREMAFSGIHLMTPSKVFNEMKRQRREGEFSVIDFYLEAIGEIPVRGVVEENLRMIDIGKPETLEKAEEFLSTL